MTQWSSLFLIVAILAGVFGFTGIASASAGVAQILFVLFTLLFVGAVATRWLRDDQ